MPVIFVDLTVKPIAPTELRRFTSRVTARALLDENAGAFRESGLAYMRLGDDEVFDRLLADQRLIRLPLVRLGSGVAFGVDEAVWKQMLASPAER